MGIGRFVRELLFGPRSNGIHVTFLKVRFGKGRGGIIEQAIWQTPKENKP